MNPSRPRTIRRFRPLAIMLVVAVSGVISAPSASFAARPGGGPPPTISINDVTITEGDAGTVTATFTVTQSKKGKTSVRYTTAPGTASNPADFLAKTGTVSFRGSHKTVQVAISIAGDTLDEANESFFVRLTNPVRATISDAEGTGTITDNDAPPTVSSVATLTVPEGNSGDTPVASIDVTLSAPSAKHVSVDFTTVNGSATAGSDYDLTAGTLEFAAGQTLGSIVVPVHGDGADEGDETFDVDLANPVNATLGAHPTAVTIQDNDPIPPGSAVLNVTGLTIREGDTGTRTLTFTVTRSGETSTAVNVDYQTTNGTASAPSDYGSVAGNLSFAATVTTATVQVPVKGDRRLERRERLFLSLINPSSGAAIEHGQARGQIRDDDTWTRFVTKKVNGRLRVHGRLSPAHPGKAMVVTLARKRNGAWVRMGVRTPVLRGRSDLSHDRITDSGFSAQFPRPNAGRCRIVARFPGDNDHGPSQLTKLFGC